MTYSGIAAGGGTSAMTKISSFVLSGNGFEFIFSSIPSTYQSLRLVGSVRTGSSNPSDLICMQFNNITSNQYQWNWNKIIANAITSTLNASNSSIPVAQATGVNQAPSTGAFDILIPFYTSSAYKQVISMTAHHGSTSTNWIPGYYTGNWTGTSAINQILLFAPSGNAFQTGSSVTLYGLS